MRRMSLSSSVYIYKHIVQPRGEGTWLSLHFMYFLSKNVMSLGILYMVPIPVSLYIQLRLYWIYTIDKIYIYLSLYLSIYLTFGFNLNITVFSLYFGLIYSRD